MTARPTTWNRAPVSIAAGVLGASFVALLVLDADNGTLRGPTATASVAWLLVAFGAFLLAVLANERNPVPIRWLWVGAIVFRLLLAATEPSLSDDVYRYLWEGHLLVEGVSPYDEPVLSPDLDAYAIGARDLTNNPDLASPYLPTAHAVFAAASLALPSDPWTMQLLMIGFDLAAGLFLVRLLRRAGLPEQRAMLYLWNPLVIVEVAHGAHLDALMVMLTLAAVTLTFSRADTRRSAWWIAPIALAAATLTRPLPLLILPVLWLAWESRQRVAYLVAVVAPVVPFALWSGWGLGADAGGTGVFGSTRAYSERFEFNSSVFHWLRSALGAFPGDADDLARTISVLIAAIVVAVVTRRAMALPVRGGAHDVRIRLRLMVTPVMVYVVITPILHPWYLVMLAALVTFVAPGDDEDRARWLAVAPWLYLMGTVSLSYLTYRDPSAFAELAWVRRVEWYPTFALLALWLIVARRRPAVAPGVDTCRDIAVEAS